MTTWAPISHPWFDHPSTKRKLSASPLNTTNSTSRSSRPSPPPKRRKISTLESGFAQLALNNALHSIADTGSHAPSSAGWPYISEFVHAPPDSLSAMDAEFQVPARDVVLPSYVEEPSTEVKMRSSSWYESEPDRIVITDLDSSSDEEESTDLYTPSISISRPLLKRLSSHAKQLINRPASSSQALVLYRPLRHDHKAENSKINEGMNSTTTVGEVTDGNSMDVEPW